MECVCLCYALGLSLVRAWRESTDGVDICFHFCDMLLS